MGGNTVVTSNNGCVLQILCPTFEDYLVFRSFIGQIRINPIREFRGPRLIDCGSIVAVGSGPGVGVSVGFGVTVIRTKV